MELSALSKLNITAPAQYKTTKPLINLNESHRVLLGCNVQRQSLNAYQSIFIMIGGDRHIKYNLGSYPRLLL